VAPTALGTATLRHESHEFVRQPATEIRHEQRCDIRVLSQGGAYFVEFALSHIPGKCVPIETACLPSRLSLAKIQNAFEMNSMRTGL
jgi:hypothetical protein